MPVHGSTSSDRFREDFGTSLLEMIASLDKAQQDAGGAPLTLNELKHLSVFQLMCRLAPNNVRFVHVPHVDKIPG